MASDVEKWPTGVLNRDKTLAVLKSHNEWRRGAEAPQTDPRILGLALDAAIAALTQPAASGEVVAWLCDARDGVNCDATTRTSTRDDYARFGRKITPLYASPQPDADTVRLDYIERTFSGCTNRERYLSVQMIWGNGCNGRSLREACDKYMARDYAIDSAIKGDK